MTHLAIVVFPIISIGCGVAVVFALTKFVKEIRRDIRSNESRACK